MANANLQGQLKPEIDHVPVISITRCSIDENAPGTSAKGGYGFIGTADGIGDSSGQFTMKVVKDQPLEVDVYRLKRSGERFTLSWVEGASRILVSSAKVTRVSRTNDPGTGNYDLNVSWMAGPSDEL